MKLFKKSKLLQEKFNWRLKDETIKKKQTFIIE